MQAAFRIRASIAQSLVRTIGKAKTPPATELIARFRADADVQAMMTTPSIGWVEERPFLALLSATHQQMGDQAYVEVVHDASMAMLKNGIFKAAQRAFTIFKGPGLPAYALWAQRMWGLSFQGLKLTYEGEDPVEGVRMVLSGAPTGGFTAPIVLGATGVVQTVFTFARRRGRVRPLPYRDQAEQVELRLRIEDT
jgi:hypothetical protein